MSRVQTRALAQQFVEVAPAVFRTLRAIAPQDNEGVATTVGQLRCLHSLEEGPQSLSQLAVHHNVSAPTMSRLVSGLVARGWVSRTEAAGDRRQVALELLPLGREALQSMNEKMLNHIAALLEGLTPDEQHALALGLQGLARVTVPGEPARRR